MMRTTGGLTAAALTAVVLLASAGCGDTDAETGGSSDRTPTSQPRPQVTGDVSMRIGHESGGATLSATNESGSRLLVLLPVGEPDEEETSNGVTLTYLRSGAAGTGEEPELYEAAAVPSGSTSRLDLSSVGTWTTKVRICLETVQPDDVAAEAGGGTYRVHAREQGAAPVVACSPMTKIHATH